MECSSRRSPSRLAALAVLAVLGGSLAAEAQAPPPPVTRKKTPTPTPRPQKGGGGGGPAAAPAAARATLLLDADLNCTVTIDGETTHRITANKPTKIEVAAGEHLLKAVS